MVSWDFYNEKTLMTELEEYYEVNNDNALDEQDIAQIQEDLANELDAVEQQNWSHWQEKTCAKKNKARSDFKSVKIEKSSSVLTWKGRKVQQQKSSKLPKM